MTESKPTIAHLATVDLSLRYLLLPQLRAALKVGVRSVGISAPGPWVVELTEFGIEHLALATSTRGRSLGKDLRAAWDLYWGLRRLRPQILHTHNPKPGLYGRIVGRLARVPIVVNTVHGLYATPDDPLMKRAIVYGLEAVAARLSDLELVQSREDAELMQRLRLAPSGRVIHLGNGVDLTRFDPSTVGEDARAHVRRELEVDDDEILVGMVGRLVREKGYVELFEAASMVGNGFVFVCIGPDDPEKADSLPPGLIERARSRGIRFLGMRTDVERFYAAMDVFVLPSHREGFPRAAMEAAAMGLPIVATDIRGCREVVEPGRSGLLVPVGDPARLAEALKSLVEADERQRMSREARRLAAERFDERGVVLTVMRAYTRLARVKGLEGLAATLAGTGPTSVDIRPASSADAVFVATLHAASIDSGFLPRLGTRFLALLYGVLADDPGGVLLVAEDDTGPVGFVAGSVSTAAFYRRFLRRYGLRALAAVGLRLLSPLAIRRAIESLRYGGTDGASGAELLSMAVVADRRGRGIAQRLGSQLLEALDTDRVRVVVGSANRVAITAYQRMGFVPAGEIEVHRGEKSEVLEWSAH